MRRRHPVTALAFGLCALLLAPATEAAGLYLFGKLGNTDTSVDVRTGFSDLIDGDDSSAGYGLGLRLGRSWAVQAEYHDLGRVPGFTSACAFEEPVCIAQAIPIEADSSAISLSILPHLLLTRRIRLYGKLGVISWDSDVSVVDDLAEDFVEKLSDEEVIYGAGLRLELPGPIDGFAEYERIADLFDTVAIGATWGF